MRWCLAALALALPMGAPPAVAALLPRDLDGDPSTVEAYYDTDINVTWLRDANLGAGSSYDDGTPGQPSTSDGRMTWGNAKAWAETLVIFGIGGWRLPTTLQPDNSCSTQNNEGSSGHGCSGSEMGHLFYIEGIGEHIDPGPGGGSFGDFVNLQLEKPYWSNTELTANNNGAWHFSFSGGDQNTNAKMADPLFAWAVHDGSVGVAPGFSTDTPEPPITLTLAAAVLALGLYCRSTRASR